MLKAWAVCVGLPLLAGAGAHLALGLGAEWYAALRKPPFTPPASALPIIWPTLHLLSGLSAFLVWRAGRGRLDLLRLPLLLWLAQLGLGLAWSIIFFGLQRPVWALLDLGLLWLVLVWMIFVFAAVSRMAAALQMPHLLWATLLAAANLFILLANEAV